MIIIIIIIPMYNLTTKRIITGLNAEGKVDRSPVIKGANGNK